MKRKYLSPPWESGDQIVSGATAVTSLEVVELRWSTTNIFHSSDEGMSEVIPTATSVENDLKVLLTSLKGPDTPLLSPSQLENLANGFTSSSTKGLATVCLSLYVERLQDSEDTEQAKINSIEGAFRPLIDAHLQNAVDVDDSTHSADLVAPTLLLANLFLFATAAAVGLLTKSSYGINGTATDALGILLEDAELPGPLQSALAELFAHATGTKLGRELVRSRGLEWLQGAVNLPSDDETVGLLSAVALSKLNVEITPDSVASNDPSSDDKADSMRNDAALCKKFLAFISAHTASPAECVSAVEGLTMLSTKSYIKAMLCEDTASLRSLLALSPVPMQRPGSLPPTRGNGAGFDEASLAPVESALCFGLTTILANLTIRRPVLSAEDEQIARLRAMAISGKKGGVDAVNEDPLESDDAVRDRVSALFRAGVVPALSGLVRAESRPVRQALGQVCLQLVEDQANRPLFIRDGGPRILAVVIRDFMSSMTKGKQTSSSEIVADSLPAIQALAKLAITTPPHLLFPPPSLTTSLNALAPLYLLLMYPSSTLLQVFEALMALTNLASIDPSIGNRIVHATLTLPPDDSTFRGSGREDSEEVMRKVEELLLADNTLLRRAASELICNLASSPDGFALFSGEYSNGKAPKSRTRSTLHILLILCDVDDVPTQLAAGGALAILMESSTACRYLLEIGRDTSQTKRGVWERLLALMAIDDDPHQGGGNSVATEDSFNVDLTLRVTIIMVNLFNYAKSVPTDEREGAFPPATIAESVRKKLESIFSSTQSEDLRASAKDAFALAAHVVVPDRAAF